jgi:branched-chain amino acid transport system permease protein
MNNGFWNKIIAGWSRRAWVLWMILILILTLLPFGGLDFFLPSGVEVRIDNWFEMQNDVADRYLYSRHDVLDKTTGQYISKPVALHVIQGKVLNIVVGLIKLFIHGAKDDPYTQDILTKTGLYTILALGLNIMPGFTGLLHLGYVAFYAVGSYATAILFISLGINFWLAIPLTVIIGALVGVLLGLPTLRLSGDYFAIVTFGFAEIVYLFVLNEKWLTGGPAGFQLERPTLFGYVFKSFPPTGFYFLVFITVLMTMFVCYRLINSRLGRAWSAIREDEIAAECSGINVTWYKIIAFAVSSGIGALAGSYFAVYQNSISPNSFKFMESVIIICMVILGGMGSIVGMVLGAAMLFVMLEALREFETLRLIIYGLIMVLIMRFRPQGLIGLSRIKEELRPDKESSSRENNSIYETHKK